MVKFILLACLTILSFNAKAQQKGARPAPTVWAENTTLDDDFFFKTTRLECIRKGIKDATGIQPSKKYLASIALKVRNDKTLEGKSENLKFLSPDNHDYRFSYLVAVSRYISTFGVCPADSSGLNGADEFVKGETSQIAEFIATPLSEVPGTSVISGKKIVMNNEEASLMILGSEYKIIDTLFSNKVDGESRVYNRLSDAKRKELAKNGIHYAKSNLQNTFPSTYAARNSFSKCLSKMEDYIEGYEQKSGGKKSGIKTAAGFVSSQDLCRSMMHSCGYDVAVTMACTDISGAAATSTAPTQPTLTAPPSETEGEKPLHRGTN